MDSFLTLRVRGFTHTPTLASLFSVLLKKARTRIFFKKNRVNTSSFQTTRATPKLVCGFTLIEMMVVISIITIVTTIALTGQSTFNRSTLLTDTAYTIALSLREMQSLGLSSQKVAGTSVTNAGYGIHVATTPNTSYLLFADTSKTSPAPLSNCPTGTVGTPEEKPGNCVYTSADAAPLQTYAFSRGFYIKQFCGTDLSGVPHCSTDSSLPLSSLDIVFLRSTTTDTIFTAQQGSGSIALSKASIYVATSDNSATRGICVSQAGQVSVVLGTCP